MSPLQQSLHLAQAHFQFKPKNPKVIRIRTKRPDFKFILTKKASSQCNGKCYLIDTQG
jgi:hypothetical protein